MGSRFGAQRRVQGKQRQEHRVVRQQLLRLLIELCGSLRVLFLHILRKKR